MNLKKHLLSQITRAGPGERPKVASQLWRQQSVQILKGSPIARLIRNHQSPQCEFRGVAEYHRI
jgi:hypothetical protein